jgi:hypothetical protein
MKSSCYFVFNHSALLCPNLYSNNLYNSLRTCSILVLVLSTALHTNLSYNRSSMYRLRTDYTENTRHVIAISPVHWRAGCCLATSYNIRPIVACEYRGMFIEPLPSNVLNKSVLLLLHVLLSNGCFCGSTVLAWSKYATVLSKPWRISNRVKKVKLSLCLTS